MHLKAMFLPYLFYYVKAENYLEYTLGNLFDKPSRQRRKETAEQYLDRITPNQAVRITRYNYLRWVYQNAASRIKPPDFSMYEPESRKTLEKLVETVFFLENGWRKRYQNALRRRMMER